MSGGIRNDGEGPTEVSVYVFTMNRIDRLRPSIHASIAEAFATPNGSYMNEFVELEEAQFMTQDMDAPLL